MKESEKFVGKIKTHKGIGKVVVDSIHESSRVLVDVTVMDRGKGFNRITNTYTGVRTKGGWHRGENREFGTKDTVHIKDLK